MSDVIHLLPDSVANQIAAGEVVQRPASVIKELMENSIDAGARKIQVKVVDAGKTEIQIVDDGVGLSETDARLAFERHATSKIQSSADLFSISTMGFRGEALASVAAVAQVELRTRQQQDELGSCLVIEGSKIISQEPVVCPVGANFMIKNLFYNTPARRKFLKSNLTELSNVIAEFEKISLYYTDKAFELYNADSMLIALQPSSFKQRIISLFGKKLENYLIPVEANTNIVKISGFVTVPEGAKKKKPNQYFYVNGRYMRNPYFNKAVQQAYERLITENEQAQYFLKMEVDPARIDVNIHPTKTEIKFEDDHSIWQILTAAVRQALGKFNAVPTLDFDRKGCPSIPAAGSATTVVQPQIAVDASYNPFQASARNSRSSAENWQKIYAGLTAEKMPVSTVPESIAPEPVDWSLFTRQSEAEPVADKAENTEVAELPESARLFQFGNARFVAYTLPDRIVFIDQHRAHYRILYDRYMGQLKQQRGISQGLLFPQLLQLNPARQALFEKVGKELTLLGFDFSDMGGGTYSINGVPDGTTHIPPEALIENLLDGPLNTGAMGNKLYHTLADRLAMQSAIPVGRKLNEEEMRSLVTLLYASSNPRYAPNGKVIVYPLELGQISKAFT